MKATSVIAIALLAFSPLGRALENAGTRPGLSLLEFDKFRTDGVPDEQWPLVLEALGHKDQAKVARSLVREMKPFPAKKLTAFLTHPLLAVRLGALELLEEAAGDDFGFDPWREEPASGGNPGALTKWQAWVEKGTPEAQPEAALTDDTFRAAAIEIMSGDHARGERGMQRMEAFGIEAVARIESFLQAQAGLEPGPRAQLKGAEYRLVLLRALPKQAAALGRDLTLGTLEQQSTALAALGDGGSAVLPILAEFLTSTDPLVRETAVDAACKAGGAHALPLLLARLGAKLDPDDPKTERTESVLHSMLRGLGKFGDAEHAAVIARYLDHPAENVVITALEALAANAKGDLTKPLAARLADPRWRVRATALETLAKRKATGLEKQIEALLDDPDSFVRISAVGALASQSSGRNSGDDDNASPALTKKLMPAFLRHDDLKPAILKFFVSSSTTAPPAEVTDALWKAPTETLLLALDLFDNRDEHFGRDDKKSAWKSAFVARFATHPNADVAASALRILASQGRSTGLLLAALKSNDQARSDAVLDVLALPEDFASGPAPASDSPASSVLDRLYRAFSSPKAKPAAGGPAPEPVAPPGEMLAVLEKFLQTGTPRQQFAAGCVLLTQRHEEAARKLVASFDTLSALDCRRVAASLAPSAPWNDGPFLELARRALRHPAGEVRETAINVWLNSAKADGLGGLLEKFSRAGSLLEADDIYEYSLHRILSETSARTAVLAWAKKVLASDATPSRKVLAIVLLGQTKQADRQGLERFLDDANPVLRRAAFRALGRPAVEARLDAVMADREALVRAVVPFVAAPQEGWTHWFDDVHSATDGEEFERNSRSGRGFGEWATGQPSKQPAVDLIPALEKLANDPAEMVRFDAQFALLRLGRPVDPAAFTALLAALPPEGRSARYRVQSWFTENFQRLGKSYAALVPALAIDGDSSSEKKLLAYFGLTDAPKPALSFQALAATAPAAPKGPDNAIAAPAPAPRPTGQPFRVLFFYKPGCRDCERVRDQLNRHAAAFPQMTVEERNIEAAREALLNETLSTRQRVPDTLHQVAPAVFTQAGALVRDAVDFTTLGTLLREAATLTPDPAWADAAAPELAAAENRITQRYVALDRGVVATAGLLDGVNPCAFATIIFLLSYLQIARRTPREILAVGAAFISAVFLAYFLVGLGLVQLLEKAAAFRLAGNVLNYALAALAVGVAVVSFRDARLAADGRLGDMTLQLPGFLKDQIRTVIRTGARARNFVIAAFAAGLVISLLELACTGQVYLPTIQFMLRGGNRDALGLLLLYNTAFIVPLVVIFILAWTGLRSDALIAFQKKHTALAKVLTGVLFLALAGFLVFGHAWLAALGGSPR